MLFNSLDFILLFMPLALLVAWALKGRALTAWLVCSSFAFYSFFGPLWFCGLMLFTTVLDFSLARLMQGRSRFARCALLAASIATNLSMLFWFKYAGLFSATLAQAFGMHWPRLEAFSASHVLPAGISFYTFQTLSYMLDVFAGREAVEKDLFSFSAFVSFFPHLVAGPLTRHHQLAPQLAAIARTGIQPRFKSGILLFSIGLIKKVLIGDKLSSMAAALGGYARFSTWDAWLYLAAFSLQIYFDFSGYTDMAIGLGRLFGVELPQNFNSPYQAASPVEFWRRWHVTLSEWLRDYLYFPLGGNRQGPLRRDLNLGLTMVLGGLWHGASWTFALWGGYHAVLLVAYHRTRAWWDRLPRLIARLMTLVLVCAGWALFKAKDLGELGLWVFALAGRNPGAAWSETQLSLAVAVAAVGIYCAASEEYSAQDLENMGGPAQALVGALAGYCLLSLGASQQFLYFQF